MIKLATGILFVLLTSFFFQVVTSPSTGIWSLPGWYNSAHRSNLAMTCWIKSRQPLGCCFARTRASPARQFSTCRSRYFLRARNADHMRMFKSYALLDNDTKRMIDCAADYDEMIAGQMQQLIVERLELESDKNHFLQKSILLIKHQVSDMPNNSVWHKMKLLTNLLSTCENNYNC